MSVLNIECKKSEAFSNNPNEKPGDMIWVGTRSGYVYWSYLYFDLTNIPINISLQSAQIVLFKIPMNKMCNYKKYQLYEEQSNWYSIAPTTEYMTRYSYCYSPPNVDSQRNNYFQVEQRLGYTEIDVFGFIRECIEGKIQNKGLILAGVQNSKWMVYGNEIEKDQGLRPFLNIEYKPNAYSDINVHAPIIELPFQVKIK